MIAYCAMCEYENEFEVLSVNFRRGTFDYEYECDSCGYTAVEESQLEN